MPPFLVADVGGTNARFALGDDRGFGDVTTFATESFDGPASAIRAFLGGAAPRAAAIACAGPVENGSARLTNAGWLVDAALLRAELGVEDVVVINDFAAVAWAIPELAEEDVVAVGRGVAEPGAPALALGAGTGLGVAAYVPCGDAATVVSGEGGHVTMPASTERESEMLSAFRRRLGHVSAERLLSGDGLARLHEWHGGPPGRSPAEITDAAASDADIVARQALNAFCAMFGTVAGDLALAFGARGGVYIAGGIVPRIADYFAASEFRRRFEAKGRFQDYLAGIPTRIVRHPHPALAGLTGLLGKKMRDFPAA